jgi:hypothetical protein
MCGRRLDTRDQRRPIGDKYKDEDRPDQRAVGTRLDLHRIADLAVDGADEEFHWAFDGMRDSRRVTAMANRVRNAMLTQLTTTGPMMATGPTWKSAAVCNGEWFITSLRSATAAMAGTPGIRGLRTEVRPNPAAAREMSARRQPRRCAPVAERRPSRCAGRKKLRIPPQQREVERADKKTRNQPDDDPTGQATLNHCLSPW